MHHKVMHKRCESIDFSPMPAATGLQMIDGDLGEAVEDPYVFFSKKRQAYHMIFHRQVGDFITRAQFCTTQIVHDASR